MSAKTNDANTVYDYSYIYRGAGTCGGIMNKWMSRTYCLIIGMIALVTYLLIYKYVTDIIWQGVAMGCVLAWVGNDVANKWKKPDAPK